MGLAAAILLGVALRTGQFVSNPSLWLDETAIARNVLDRSLISLITTPLDYGQTAPPGFLILTKAATAIWAPQDAALRLVPFVGSLVALVAFGVVASRVLTGAGALVSVTLFATAFPLIYFATQAKQYSTDVLGCITLLGCAQALRYAISVRARIALAIAGAVVPWVSQPGVLVAGATGVVLLFFGADTLRATRGRRDIVPVIAVWAVSAAASTLYAMSLMTQDTREYLRQFWATGFPPLTLATAMRTWWPWDQLSAFIASGGAGGGRIAVLGYPLPAWYALVGLAGLAALWRRDRASAACVAGVPIVTLAAAIARQYPFSDRLIVFLLPCGLLALGAALEWVPRGRWHRPVTFVIGAALVVPACLSLARFPPPYSTEPIKPVLAHVEARRAAGELVYVYYAGMPAVDLYAEPFGLDTDVYYAGGCHRGNSRAYLRELDALRGHRVWIVITHALPQFRERELLLAYLDAIGTRRSQMNAPGRRFVVGGLPAEAFLYDLRELGAPDAPSAESFSFNDTSPPTARLACLNGPATIRPKYLKSFAARADGSPF
jgi:hypothetical protein